MASNAEQLQKIFVGGLNKDGDEISLTDAFKPYGRILSATVLRDSSGKSRGFGFVVFEDSASVDDIMKAKKEGKTFFVSRSPVEVKRALPKVDRSDLSKDRSAATRYTSSASVKKVFVGGLASTACKEDLERYFSQFGKVLEVTVLFDKETLRSRGFGFVVFDDEDTADKVCAVRNHSITGKLCEVRKAEPRSALLSRKEKEAMNQSAFRNQGDVLIPQQAAQPIPFDVGNINSAIQVLNSLQNLLSAAQIQQVLNQSVPVPSTGIGYGMVHNIPMQNQTNNTNQNILQLLQAALANQNSQNAFPNSSMNAQGSNSLSSFLGQSIVNPAPSVPASNALGLLSSLAGVGQKNTSNIKADISPSQLNQNAATSTLSGASVSNANLSYYDDEYGASSQTSSAYGPVRIPTRSDSKSSSYQPY